MPTAGRRTNAPLPAAPYSIRMDFIMEFINYAHRGASAYAPENTLAAFYMG